MSFRAELARLADIWFVACDRGQQDRLVAFASLLLTWNARINLTGAGSLGDLAAEHLPDSFALASRLDPVGSLGAVDVGSGGGLPGIPLAVLRPTLRLQLVEPIAKKAAFLRTAVRELGLGPQVTVRVARAEALDRGQFDVAFSRATFAPAAWASVGTELVSPGGRVFVLAAAAAAELVVPAGTTKTGEWPYFGDQRALLELTRSSVAAS